MNIARDLRKLICAFACAVAFHAAANPYGMSVRGGSASLSQNGSQLTITTSQNAFLNWQSFNIAEGETTIFNQPSATSITWNRINDQNPSQIFGNLQANGVVVLLNSSGFYFGPNSFVSAAGLVVSTANCVPPQNSGGSWEFNGPPPLASIVNYGKISVGQSGYAFLIADNIENHGEISAPGGTIGLASGQTVLLSERPDGRGMSMEVTLPGGSVNNDGKLVADAGTIAMDAKVVNQNGFIQANSVRDQNGVIELVADNSLNLGANSQIIANGDGSIGGSAGGSVTLKSGNNFSDIIGGKISVAGGSQGGNGGSVEISAANISDIQSQLNGSTQAGFTGGSMLLDPTDLTLDNNSLSPYSGFANILFQATGNIMLAANTAWDLTGSTGVGTGLLTLQAGGNIVFGNNAKISDANNWSLTLDAGYNSGAVQSGVGNIFLNGGSGLNGNGLIRLSQGSVNLLAGQGIQVGSGSVITTGGGSITAHALAGSVNTGTLDLGYLYNQATTTANPGNYFYVNPNSGLGLGGISTAKGGDVTIIAGQNITSLLPSSSDITDAGSGAFGPVIGSGTIPVGNVTLVAGGNITGHYVVANGVGTIVAGAQMDANGNPILSGGNYVLNPLSTGSAGTSVNELALSLISGGWDVTAANDIYLQEVRNPNGIFNNKGNHLKPTNHYFDYSQTAYANLNAGDAVFLGANQSNLPRNSGEDIPVILPPVLNIAAGAGGVTLVGDNNPSARANEMDLFPSPYGSLTITTTGGGSLNGSESFSPSGNNDGFLFNLIVSDSSQSQFNVFDSTADTFGVGDHTETPVHMDNETPIVLNISGGMNNILMVTPEAAQITVGGDMNNSRFSGQNLHPTDVTSISVGGDILNRSEFTTIPLAAAPNLALLNQAYPPDPLYTSLFGHIFYDAATHQLTVQGPLTPEMLGALQSLQIQVYVNDVPQTDQLGNPILQTVSILDTATIQALQDQYAALGPVSESAGNGFLLGGGGQFNVSAHNMDLGSTLGIQSVGWEFNPSLVNVFTRGADINVNLSGNLDMFSTAIASLAGGNIYVNAGGSVNIGSTIFTGNNNNPRGIFTAGQSDVSVIAGGDINLNGSRVAAYNGGNVTVESLNGNISAGKGASGYVTVQEFGANPDHSINYDVATIPGSGILATTFSDSPNPVGNILVETPNGNIDASAGGIVQLALNGVDSSSSTVTVLAGEDADGNILSPGRNIDASGSGIIGSTVTLKASGDIIGLIFARNNLDVNAQQNVNVTALSQGAANVSGDSISGTVIGVGGITASGNSIDASLLSNNSISGATSSQSGLAQGTAANSASQSAAVENQTIASTDTQDDDEKKKGKGATLKKVGRVTVELPSKNSSPKNLSEKQSPTHRL